MGSYHHPSTVPPTSSHRTVRAEVDPEYLEKNPWYRGPPEGSPVIGLGGPFPRVIRRRRRDSAETRLPSRSPECPEHCLECGGNLKSLSSSPSIVATHLSYLAAPSRVTPRHYREYRNKYARFRAVFAKPLGEFLATFILIFLGTCVNFHLGLLERDSQLELKSSLRPAADCMFIQSPPILVQSSGEKLLTLFISIFAWGFAVMIGIFASGGISGSHLSPGISVTLALFRQFPWRLVPMYICIQIFASFTAMAAAYGLHHERLSQHSDYHALLASAIMHKPRNTTALTIFLTDFVGAASLLCSVFALGDDENCTPGPALNAVIIGLLCMLFSLALGYNTHGPVLNGAADLAGRVFMRILGYQPTDGTEWPFDVKFYWLWGPWVAVLSGAAFGGFVYDLMCFRGSESPINYQIVRQEESSTFSQVIQTGGYQTKVRRLKGFFSGVWGGRG